MGNKKQKYIKRLLPGEIPRVFNIVVYFFMFFLTSIALVGWELIEETTPAFESWIILLVIVSIAFWIIKECFLRIHWIYMPSGIILFVAILTQESDLMGTSIAVLGWILILYVLDYFGLLTRFIRFMNELIKREVSQKGNKTK